MKRLLLFFTIVALAAAPTALAKGPTSATLEGPGTDRITFSSYNEPGVNLTHITQRAGFFAAVFGGQAPDPMLANRPKGELGPKYTLTYGLGPGQSRIVQEVYPYAKPAPVTYTRPGQKVYDRASRGGWFQAGPELKTTLVSAGLPATAPAAGSTGSSDGSSFPGFTVALVASALLLVGATALLFRRRARPAAA